MIDAQLVYVKKAFNLLSKNAFLTNKTDIKFRGIRKWNENCSTLNIFVEDTVSEDIFANFQEVTGELLKMKTKILTLTLGITALVSAGCETTANNANVRNANLANSNTAVVVNNNSNMVNMNTSNANRTMNSNVNRADYDKNRAEYEKDKGTSTIGQGANDSWIWFKTKSALATTDDLRDSTINVDVVNDVITLKGTVATAAEKTKAEATAKTIEGQKGVKNELKVQSGDSMTNQMVNGNSSSNSSANTNRK